MGGKEDEDGLGTLTFISSLKHSNVAKNCKLIINVPGMGSTFVRGGRCLNKQQGEGPSLTVDPFAYCLG